MDLLSPTSLLAFYPRALSALWQQQIDIYSKLSLISLFILAGIGFVVTLTKLFYVVGWTYTLVLRPSKNLRKNFGQWAIVTGATDGIGRALAIALAKKKINVISVSRTQEKLEELGAELEAKYGVRTKSVTADFADGGSVCNALKILGDLVSELEVGILINNVGVSYPYAQFFHEIDDALIDSLIKVNIEATTKMTRLVLPAMLRRKRGAVVNIGSGAASVLPSDPLYSVYAGTKAYVDQLSRNLYVEYKSKGIFVQCQAPLYVSTKLSKIRKSSWTCPSPSVYAACALSSIGYESRVTPYPIHTLMWAVIARIPEFLMDSIRMTMNLSVRKRALAKISKKKQEE